MEFETTQITDQEWIEEFDYLLSLTLLKEALITLLTKEQKLLKNKLICIKRKPRKSLKE